MLASTHGRAPHVCHVGPFEWSSVAGSEVAYYKTQMNEFGVPMDMRHTYVKLDWMSWAACMAEKQSDFEELFNPIVAFSEATPDRAPLTDLYDTIDATKSLGGFMARPVVGGIFCRMLYN